MGGFVGGVAPVQVTAATEDTVRVTILAGDVVPPPQAGTPNPTCAPRASQELVKLIWAARTLGTNWDI